MSDDRGDRARSVANHDRFDELPMLADDGLQSRLAEAHALPVVMEQLPSLADDALGIRIACGAVDPGVEFAICLQQLASILRGGDRLERRGEAGKRGKLLVGTAIDATTDQQCFQRSTQIVLVRNELGVDRSEGCAAMGLDLDDTLGAEAAQGVTRGHVACPVVIRHRRDPQALARCEHAGDDVTTDPIGEPIGRGVEDAGSGRAALHGAAPS